MKDKWASSGLPPGKGIGNIAPVNLESLGLRNVEKVEKVGKKDGKMTVMKITAE